MASAGFLDFLEARGCTLVMRASCAQHSFGTSIGQLYPVQDSKFVLSLSVKMGSGVEIMTLAFGACRHSDVIGLCYRMIFTVQHLDVSLLYAQSGQPSMLQKPHS